MNFQLKKAIKMFKGTKIKKQGTEKKLKTFQILLFRKTGHPDFKYTLNNLPAAVRRSTSNEFVSVSIY